MPVIDVSIEVLAPVGVVFDVARDIGVHQQSQGRHGERAIAGRLSGLIEEGETVTWEAVHLGIRQRLSSKIVRMVRPTHFRDSMIAGAFQRFDHDHFFEEIEPGWTRMRDVFDYTSPFGILGRLADLLFLERYLRTFLVERGRFIKTTAELRMSGPQSSTG